MVAGAEKVMLPEHITLTGFMGSGKSSVARAVAAKLIASVNGKVGLW